MRWLLCFLPPLAVLSCGKPFQFILSCLLTACLYVPGVIHAFAVVGQYHADKRNEQLIRAIGGGKRR